MNKVIKKFDIAACAVGQARGAVFMPCADLGTQLEETRKLLDAAHQKIEESARELEAWRIAQRVKLKQTQT